MQYMGFSKDSKLWVDVFLKKALLFEKKQCKKLNSTLRILKI